MRNEAGEDVGNGVFGRDIALVVGYIRVVGFGEIEEILCEAKK